MGFRDIILPMIAKPVTIQLDTFDPDILTKAKEQISLAMDEEIKQFNQALRGVKLESLTAYERTMVKTYIAWKLGLQLK